ncbi:MAG: sigma-70 family RNA polymerase sigma factor [Planctomycetes bacterium]|nr:sigma-70 family RNA polymerase sigma factor [Planctomycetota bacterium]
MPSASDTKSLTLAAQTGDPLAVEALIERYLPPLHAFIRLRAGARLRDRSETVDLAQSACREVLTDLDGQQWVSEARFRQWLFTAAESKLQDRRRYWNAEKRRADREVRPHDDQGLPSWDQVLAAYGPSPSQLVVAKEQVERLENAFAELSGEEREIILLARIVGLGSAEIGERLEKSETAVRKALSRATARLLRQLRGD